MRRKIEVTWKGTFDIIASSPLLELCCDFSSCCQCSASCHFVDGVHFYFIYIKRFLSCLCCCWFEFTHDQVSSFSFSARTHFRTSHLSWTSCSFIKHVLICFYFYCEQREIIFNYLQLLVCIGAYTFTNLHLYIRKYSHRHT